MGARQLQHGLPRVHKGPRASNKRHSRKRLGLIWDPGPHWSVDGGEANGDREVRKGRGLFVHLRLPRQARGQRAAGDENSMKEPGRDCLQVGTAETYPIALTASSHAGWLSSSIS
eukprot:7153678-Pyramimonas_sp.AAC.1